MAKSTDIENSDVEGVDETEIQDAVNITKQQEDETKMLQALLRQKEEQRAWLKANGYNPADYGV